MCCPPWSPASSPAAVTQVSCLLLSALPRQAELRVHNVPTAASALAFEFQRQSRGHESLAEIKTWQLGGVPAIFWGATVGWWWRSAAWPAKLLLAVSAALRVMQKNTGSGSFLHYLYFWMFAGCTRSCVFLLGVTSGSSACLTRESRRRFLRGDWTLLPSGSTEAFVCPAAAPCKPPSWKSGCLVPNQTLCWHLLA